MAYFPVPYKEAPDAQPVRGSTLDDLNWDQIQGHIQRAITRGRYTGTPDPITYMEQHRGIAHMADVEQPVPTVAGLLLFGHSPQRHLPHATAELGHFYGTKTLLSEIVHLEKNISGTIFEQIEKIERYLWANIRHGFRLEEGFQRIEEHEYPQEVLREITVNAFAHRDYTVGQVVRIALFRDRIEWHNPGRLPEGVTIDNICTAQVPRNPAVLLFLYQAGFVEGFGMGWDTVFQVLNDEELPPPQLRETAASFIVTVHGRPRIDFMNEPDMPLPEMTVSQREIYAIVVKLGAVSRTEIERNLVERSTRSIQRDLQTLIDLGLITTKGAGRALRYWAMR